MTTHGRAAVPGGSSSIPCARVSRSEDIPPADPRAIDVAILDFNHGRPNTGHDSLVLSVGAIQRDLGDVLEAAGLSLRVISYAVRTHAVVPDPPGGRFSIYIGTGGPGHIDPTRNDGQAEWSHGIREDPSWEPSAHRLFEAILADRNAAMLGVCHTFGVLCRWSGVARPTLRGPEKGGESRGIKENVLSDEASRHPWFGRFVPRLPEGRRLTIRDSRRFDLLPERWPLPSGMTAIGYEATSTGEPGDPVTMLELARDPGGVMPRFFGVNHHPEVYDPRVQKQLLDEKLARDEVTAGWYAERQQELRHLADRDTARKIRLTARMTLLDPLRFHILRQVRKRHERFAGECPVREDDVLAAAR